MSKIPTGFSELESAQMERLRQAEQEEVGVKLPFHHLLTWVINGNAELKDAQAKARYFGGFAMDSEAAGSAVESGDIPALPKGWASFSKLNEKQEEYHCLSSRHIAVAVIKGRQSWLSKDGVRSAKYSDGFPRRHIQYLAAMFIDGSFFSPVVISAKGFQAMRIIDSIKAWEKELNRAKKEFSIGKFPRAAFVMSIGTHGEKPEFETVGSVSKNKITPIKAIIPAKIDEAELDRRFVGMDNLRLFVKMFDDAEQWLDAWKEDKALAVDAPAPYVGEDDF